MNSQADQAKALGKQESTSGVRLSRSVIAEQSVMRAYDGKRRHREERSKKPDTIPNEHTGDCSPDAHARLQEVVDARCRDSAGMRCDKGMSLEELKQNLSRASQCVDAQKEINERCFRGGDDIHKKKVRERTVPVENCKELIQRETERQKLREFLETAGWASAAILAVYAIVVWAPAMVFAALMAAGASRVFALEAMEYAGIKSANPNENDDEGRSGERPADQLQNDGITKTESETIPKVIQPKLIVNTPGDKYEQEADRVAEQVMRMPEPKVQRQCSCGKSSTEGECSECKKKKQESIGTLQRVARSPIGGIAAPPIVDSVLSSPGSPLPESTRAFMESRFGHDFSHVRVHTDQRAAESAAAVQAKAYTVGSNIVFGRGEHPGRNQQLLAHELVHTVQQRGTRVIQRQPEIDGEASEDSLGKSAGGRPVKVYHFPGRTSEVALVIGGVHGSELSGIEIAELLVERLKTAATKPYYTVAVVPCLFPDNRELAENNPNSIGKGTNIGRETTKNDKVNKTNRNMPALGKAFDPKHALDADGDPIQPENIMLLQLVERFKPVRIASVHATRPKNGKDNSGIYADPKTDGKFIREADNEMRDTALGVDEDAYLAIRMAKNVAGSHPSLVPHNKLTSGRPSAVYPLDEPFAKRGEKQSRDTKDGVSHGGYFTTAIPGGRPALTVITMEVQTSIPSLMPPKDPKATRDKARRAELDAYARSLQDVFLEVFVGPPEAAELKKNR